MIAIIGYIFDSFPENNDIIAKIMLIIKQNKIIVKIQESILIETVYFLLKEKNINTGIKKAIEAA